MLRASLTACNLEAKFKTSISSDQRKSSREWASHDSRESERRVRNTGFNLNDYEIDMDDIPQSQRP